MQRVFINTKQSLYLVFRDSVGHFTSFIKQKPCKRLGQDGEFFKQSGYKVTFVKKLAFIFSVFVTLTCTF